MDDTEEIESQELAAMGLVLLQNYKKKQQRSLQETSQGRMRNEKGS